MTFRCCSCSCGVTAGDWRWFSAAQAMRMRGARAHQRSSPGRGADALRWRQDIRAIDVQTTLLPPRRVGSCPSTTFLSNVASVRGLNGVRSGIGWGLFGWLLGGGPLLLHGVGSWIWQSREDGWATTAFLLGGWVQRGSTNPRGRWFELLQRRVSQIIQLARWREGYSARAPTGFVLLSSCRARRLLTVFGARRHRVFLSSHGFRLGTCFRRAPAPIANPRTHLATRLLSLSLISPLGTSSSIGRLEHATVCWCFPHSKPLSLPTPI